MAEDQQHERGPTRQEGAATPPQRQDVSLEGTVLIDRDALQRLAGQNGAAAGAVPRTELQTPRLFDYLNKLRRGKWLIVAAVAAVLIYTAARIRQTTPVYAATAVLRVEPKSHQLQNFTSLSAGSASYEDLKTAVDMIDSIPVMERVVKSLGLVNDEPAVLGPEAEPSIIGRLTNWARYRMHQVRVFLVPLPATLEVDPIYARAAALRNSVNVSRGEDNFLVYVTYYHTENTFAARVANEICEQYIQYSQSVELAKYVRLNEVIASEVNAQREQLEQAKSRLVNQFREDPELSLANADRLAQNRLSELQSSLEEMESELKSMQLENKMLAEAENPAFAFLLEEMPDLRLLYRQLDDAELKLARSLLTYEARSDQIKQIEAEIAGLKELIQEKTQQAIEARKAQEELLRERVALKRTELEEAKNRLGLLLEKLHKVEVTQRDVHAEETKYDNLLQGQKDLDIGTKIEPSRATVIQPASTPRFPVEPNVRRDLFQAGILGLLLGVGLIFLRDYLDRSVHSAFEVESAANLPTLGHVPHLKDLKPRESATNTLYYDPTSHHAEAFRFLRTSIMYATPDRTPRVILVASSVSREGKTTTSINLGVTMARLGARTLILDCDLKKPSCHQALGMPRKPGLTDYLTGNVGDLDSCFRQTSVENLFLMPTGSDSPAAADLFDSEALNRLLREVRQRFDFVVVDSFPLTVGAGTFALAAKVDATVLVVVPGRTPRDLLLRNLNRLKSINARVIGGIYNFTTSSAERRAYGYGYSYGYGYGARYGRQYEAAARTGGKNGSGGGVAEAERDRTGTGESPIHHG